MSGVLSIGHSGLMAARARLETTSQNIANANTPGYLSRDVVTRENTASEGVEVSDVRRSFDGLLTARLSEARSAQGAANAFQTEARALETQMMDDSNGITTAVDTLFDGLDAVARAPDEPIHKRLVIQAGDEFTAQVRSLAHRLDTQASDVEVQRTNATEQANTLLGALAEIDQRLATTTETSARNPLLDLRGQKLDELAEIVPIHVQLNDANHATVRLGSDLGGTVLLKEGTAGRLDAAANGRVNAYAAGNHGNPTSWRPDSGILGGLADAATIISEAQDGLDAWSGSIAAEMNALHQRGVTADGTQGRELFLTAGWQATPGATTRGTPVAEMLITDEAVMPTGPITLVRDADAGQWLAFDANNTQLASGADGVSLPGLSVSVTGTALNGDRLTLSRNDTDAGAFRFALSDPDDIASGGAVFVTPDATNTGDSAVSLTGTPPAGPRELRVLDAATQSVGLFDAASGAQIGAGTLDAAGSAQFEGYSITFSTPTATGDTFAITPNTGSPGDGRNAQALADLRLQNATTGTGGYASAFAALQQDTGAHVASGEIRLATAESTAHSAEQAVASNGGVDLDEQAARLIAQQQAYQANAQVISVARDMFETLMRAL